MPGGPVQIPLVHVPVAFNVVSKEHTIWSGPAWGAGTMNTATVEEALTSGQAIVRYTV